MECILSADVNNEFHCHEYIFIFAHIKGLIFIGKIDDGEIQVEWMKREIMVRKVR